jgi:hypothetical protein
MSSSPFSNVKDVLPEESRDPNMNFLLDNYKFVELFSERSELEEFAQGARLAGGEDQLVVLLQLANESGFSFHEADDPFHFYLTKQFENYEYKVGVTCEINIFAFLGLAGSMTSYD